jgi:hypothetical protein
MKKFLLHVIGLYLLCFSCSPKEKTFQEFNPDPLKIAYIKNGVIAYVTYENGGLQVEKGDTVTIDSKGNIVRIKTIGPWPTLRDMRYDSLNRLIFISEESDITNFIKLSYETQSEKKLIRREFLSDSLGGSHDLVYQTITEFDPELGRPIMRTDIHLSNPDTVQFAFLYDEGKLVKEVKLPESDSIYTKYDT